MSSHLHPPANLGNHFIGVVHKMCLLPRFRDDRRTKSPPDQKWEIMPIWPTSNLDYVDYVHSETFAAKPSPCTAAVVYISSSRNAMHPNGNNVSSTPFYNPPAIVPDMYSSTTVENQFMFSCFLCSLHTAGACLASWDTCRVILTLHVWVGEAVLKVGRSGKI